jgi:hypothetical protein
VRLSYLLLYSGWPGPRTPAGTILDFESALVKARQDRSTTTLRSTSSTRDSVPSAGTSPTSAWPSTPGGCTFSTSSGGLQEGTPFYPGHEIYFGHASTPDFFEVGGARTGDAHSVRHMGGMAHVWAPCVIRRGDEFIMAYTGINRHISQNIGLASSRDLFEWKRWESNPISPCKDKAWAAWREDHISSCRDPNLFEHEGRWWMNYCANTREGASCIALASTTDFKRLAGPRSHLRRSGQRLRDAARGRSSPGQPGIGQHRASWRQMAHDRQGQSSREPLARPTGSSRAIGTTGSTFAARREFWPEGFGIEIVRNRGDRTLLATFFGGYIRFGTVDWSADSPRRPAHRHRRGTPRVAVR